MERVKAKVLRCILCDTAFSELDVESLDYFPVEQICFRCYTKASKQPHRVWCFGKNNVIGDGGTIKAYGYDPERSSDCRKYCPDRKICYLFSQGFIGILRKMARARPFESGSVLSKAFALCLVGTTVERLKELIQIWGGEVGIVMKKLKKGSQGRYRWRFVKKESKVRIRL